MKRLAYILLSLLVLAACTSTSRNPHLVAADSLLLSSPDSALTLLRSMSFSSTPDRMYHYLLLADAANKCYDTLPSDTILQEVADFYDTHGTPNEQVRAHYLLGCAYRDMGEAPKALDCYHDAVLCADTAAADCDFHTLSRVHSQIAALLGEQLLPHQQLEELHLQYADAMRAKDTLCALNAMGQMTNAYDMLGMPDSTIKVAQRLISLYEKHGLSQKAAIFNGIIATSLVDMHHYQEARNYLNYYECHTGFFDETGNIEQGREIFYGTKGRYFLGVNQYDSADYYFRKELKMTTDLNNHEYAYRGLFMLYQMTGQRDSMSKYARLAYKTTDAHFQEKQSDELRHMQALYNYSRNQSIARQKTAEANRNRQIIIIGLFTFVMTMVIISFGIYMYRRKKREQMRMLQKQYEHDVESLEQAKYDLMKMQEAQITHLVAEKEADIKQLHERLETYGQSLTSRKQQTIESSLAETAIYQRLRHLVTHPREKVSQEEWKQLRDMIDQTLPGFHSTLYNAYQLKPSDYDICILDRLYFSPSEIAMLTGNGLSNISMKRTRMLEKLFHITGKGEQFDTLIRNIS